MTLYHHRVCKLVLEKAELYIDTIRSHTHLANTLQVRHDVLKKIAQEVARELELARLPVHFFDKHGQPVHHLDGLLKYIATEQQYEDLPLIFCQDAMLFRATEPVTCNLDLARPEKLARQDDSKVPIKVDISKSINFVAIETAPQDTSLLKPKAGTTNERSTKRTLLPSPSKVQLSDMLAAKAKVDKQTLFAQRKQLTKFQSVSGRVKDLASSQLGLEGQRRSIEGEIVGVVSRAEAKRKQEPVDSYMSSGNATPQVPTLGQDLYQGSSSQFRGQSNELAEKSMILSGGIQSLTSSVASDLTAKI